MNLLGWSIVLLVVSVCLWLAFELGQEADEPVKTLHSTRIPRPTERDVDLARRYSDWLYKSRAGFSAPAVHLRPGQHVRALLAGNDSRSTIFLACLDARRATGQPTPLESWRAGRPTEKARQAQERQQRAAAEPIRTLTGGSGDGAVGPKSAGLAAPKAAAGRRLQVVK